MSLKQISPGDADHSEMPCTGDEWLRMMEECDVRFVMLNQSRDRGLIDTFQRQPGWSIDFEDKEAVIFIREGNR